MQRLSKSSASLAVRGSLTIHSAPSALRSHIDWAIADFLGTGVQCSWSPQILKAGTYKCVLTWRDREGIAATLASALGGWHFIYFEVQEDGNNGGELFRFIPELGIHRALTDPSGAVVLNENQINSVLENSFDEESIRLGISQIIGSDWERELEPFRGIAHQEIGHLRAI